MTDVIYNVKNTQFSIARYYGGVKINGVFYVYNPIEDSLTKESILKKTKMKKKKDRNEELWDVISKFQDSYLI